MFKSKELLKELQVRSDVNLMFLEVILRKVCKDEKEANEIEEEIMKAIEVIYDVSLRKHYGDVDEDICD